LKFEYSNILLQLYSCRPTSARPFDRQCSQQWTIIKHDMTIGSPPLVYRLIR